MSNIIKLEIVEKYNPYHDSKGRFTSAGSATSFTIGSKSGLEWDKKNVQRAIEREKQRTSAKEDGPTKIKRVESELKGMLNKSATVDFTGMDPDVAEETAAEIKKVLDKYPGCKDAYGGFSTEEPVPGYFRVNENVVACYVPHTKTIHLNPNSYGNK
ncbi:MAG: hypothetical protein IIV02_04250, partial [Peptococcaceae bacterium]|nr:hypothetical protein [Peptococcaceae bacterium]